LVDEIVDVSVELTVGEGDDETDPVDEIVTTEDTVASGD